MGVGAGGGDKPPVNQALDSIMGMAVQLPALKKIGEELGVSMDKGVAGLAESLVGETAQAASEETPAGEIDVSESERTPDTPKPLPAAE